MTTLHVNLPDELRAKAEARAAEDGHDNLETYILSLIRSDAEEYTGDGPSHLTPRSRQELESMLLEGLASPAAPMTKEDWDDLRRQLRERAGK